MEEGSAARCAQALAQLALRASSVDRLEELRAALTEATTVLVVAERVEVHQTDRPEGDQAATGPEDAIHAHVMTVPIVLADEVWGELVVSRSLPRPFTDTDRDLVTVVATLATTGLARIQGDERLRALAYADPLTGLANRRAADDRLEEWASDPTDALGLTVILCDVNGLKQVNDTHGHIVGDGVIREVAEHVSAAARRLPRGFAARIGGDEFLVASPCGDEEVVASALSELTETAARLPYADGLSCGSASASQLLQPETSPQSLVRSLLRMADAEQYRRKLTSRQAAGSGTNGRTQPPPGASRTWRDAAEAQLPQPGYGVRPRTRTEANGRRTPGLDVGDVSGWFTGFHEQASVQQRLSHAAHIVSDQAGAVAWWISTADTTAGTVQAIACGVTRTGNRTDGLWPPVQVDPMVYRLADFPMTVRALAGDVFFADTFTGDAVERRLLIQLGFQSMIAAGGTDDEGCGWLVEIYGDSLTQDLHQMMETLHRATTLAISRREPDRSPYQRAQRRPDSV